jgi:hypothetical protein
MQIRVSNTLFKVEQKRGASLKDPRLDYLHEELGRLYSLVQKKWPLPAAEASDFSLGMFAARELEDFHPDLAEDVYFVSGRLSECLSLQN